MTKLNQYKHGGKGVGYQGKVCIKCQQAVFGPAIWCAGGEICQGCANKIVREANDG